MPGCISQKTQLSRFLRFGARFVAKRYILQQKCLIGTCLLGTRWYNIYVYTPTQRATMHSVTDRQTDRQTDRCHDDDNSRSYCVSNRL